MATFLELVNDVGRESGTIQSTQNLSALSEASPRHQKIIAHVRSAWLAIQRGRSDFTWRVRDFSHALTVNQMAYSADDFGLTDVSRWLPRVFGEVAFSLYDTSLGQGDQMPLCPVDAGYWRSNFKRGLHDAQRPTVFAIDADGTLCVGGKPDKAYILTGSYLRAPQVLADDDDVPICPEEFHDVITARALMLLAGHDEAQFGLADASANFTERYRALVMATTPRISLG